MGKTYLTLAQMLEQSNAAESKLYKWALVGTELRFVHVIFNENHKMLVEDGETAQAAGTISINNTFWRNYGWGSTTLNVGCSGEAADALELALQKGGRDAKRY